MTIIHDHMIITKGVFVQEKNVCNFLCFSSGIYNMGNRTSKQRSKYTKCLLLSRDGHRGSRSDQSLDKTWCLKTANTLLLLLDKGNNIQVKKTLLRQSYHVRKILVTLDVNGVSCVYLACIRENSDIMEFFMTECEINPNMEIVSTGESILQLSCQRGNINVAHCLIQHGACIDKKGSNGQTCIEACCRNERVCMFLVEHGVKVNDWKDESNRPVIFQACEQGNVELFDFLLKHDADINVTNDEGLSPLDVASRKCLQGCSFQYIVERLMKNNETNPQDVLRAAETMFCNIVQLFLHEPTNFRKTDHALEFWHFFQISKVYHLVGDIINFDAYALTNNDIPLKTGAIKTRIKSDIGLVFYISVQMTCNVYGGNSIKTINFVLDIVNFLCHQKVPQEKFADIIQSIFITSLKPIITVSQDWINEFIIILINFIRICKTPDETLCKFGIEAVLWVIYKLDPYTAKQVMSLGKENQAEQAMFLGQIDTAKRVMSHDKMGSAEQGLPREKKDPAEETTPLDKTVETVMSLDKIDAAEIVISLDTVMPMFSLLKLLFSWEFPCKELRQRCLNQVMTEVCHCNFTYASLSILHFGVLDFICSNHQDNRRSHNCEDVIVSLLDHGMSTDTTDKLGNTPLMFMLLQLPHIDRFSEDLVEYLTDFSHLDIKNIEGLSALTLLKRHGRGVCEVKHRTLQCLCAEVMKQLGIPYSDFVPRDIAGFISQH